MSSHQYDSFPGHPPDGQPGPALHLEVIIFIGHSGGTQVTDLQQTHNCMILGIEQQKKRIETSLAYCNLLDYGNK